jgi:hypothetical protein
LLVPYWHGITTSRRHTYSFLLSLDWYGLRSRTSGKASLPIFAATRQISIYQVSFRGLEACCRKFVSIHLNTTSDAGPNARPIENPKRSWSESIADDWTFTLGQTQQTVKGVYDTLYHFFAFQAILQFLVTLAQHLGANFLHGRDVVGFYPRFVANMLSIQNLYDPDGLEPLTTHLGEIFTFWSDWVNGIWWICTYTIWVTLGKVLQAMARVAWSLVVRGGRIAVDAEERHMRGGWSESESQTQYQG